MCVHATGGWRFGASLIDVFIRSNSRGVLHGSRALKNVCIESIDSTRRGEEDYNCIGISNGVTLDKQERI